jgi:hypothetical protein
MTAPSPPAVLNPATESGTNGELAEIGRLGGAVPDHAPLVMAGVLVQVVVKPVGVIGGEPA